MTESEQHTIREDISDIRRRMDAGEDVSLQDQLTYYRYREKVLSPKVASGDVKAHLKLDKIRLKIEEINERIMTSGHKGGGVMGQGSIHATGNTTGR